MLRPLLALTGSGLHRNFRSDARHAVPSLPRNLALSVRFTRQPFACVYVPDVFLLLPDPDWSRSAPQPSRFGEAFFIRPIGT